MRDFAHELDERLQQLVGAASAPTSPATPSGTPEAAPAAEPAQTGGIGSTRRRALSARTRRTRGFRLRRDHALLGGAGAVGTVALSAVLLTGTSAAGLPVLKTPTRDATNFAKGVQLSAHDIDLRDAHIVSSDLGQAAILTSPNGEKVCLAIPDPLVRHAPIGTCSPTGRVEAHGLLVQAMMVAKGGQPAPRGAFAYILPVGASEPHLTEGGAELPVAVRSGIVLAYPQDAGSLRYRIRGRIETVPISGPFQGERGQCGVDGADPNGFTPEPEPGSMAGGAPGHLSAAHACGVTPIKR